MDFDFALLKQRLEALEVHVSERNISRIALHAGILAEDLEKCRAESQDKDTRDLCAEIGSSIRAVELYSDVPAIAARHLKQAIEALRASRSVQENG